MKGIGRSRISDFIKREIHPPLPVIEVGRYLYEIAQKTDFVSRGFDGPMPLTWSELSAIKVVFDLDQTETEILRAMSCAFLDGLKLGEDPLGISPMEQTDD